MTRGKRVGRPLSATSVGSGSPTLVRLRRQSRAALRMLLHMLCFCAQRGSRLLPPRAACRPTSSSWCPSPLE